MSSSSSSSAPSPAPAPSPGFTIPGILTILADLTALWSAVSTSLPALEAAVLQLLADFGMSTLATKLRQTLAFGEKANTSITLEDFEADVDGIFSAIYAGTGVEVAILKLIADLGIPVI